MMQYVGAVASATDLPVSADLEGGYGDDPDTVAETIRLADFNAMFATALHARG